MAEKITFTSVELDKFGRDKNGVWSKFVSSLNSSVMQKMGWTEIPECLTGADLEGEIAAISLLLVPNDRPEKGALEIELSRIVEFKTVRRELEGKQGKGHRTELRFKVVSQDMRGARKLEEYMMSNLGKAKLIVSYEKVATQAELPGAEEDTGCIACNNHIPMQEGSTKRHDNGQKCSARPVQEALQ